MSIRPSFRTATNLLPRPARLCPRIPVLAFARSYSDVPAPPLLQKLKADLKTAMREKNAARLSVVRGVLAATLNASKTSSPITTDVALVALLRKQARACADARAEFEAAGRADLVEKEAAQIVVLEEYMAGSGVEELGEDQLRAVVRDTAASLGEKPKLGDIMKALVGPDGRLSGKSFEKAELARIVNETLAV
ncbi:Yqey-like protein-domain-containing protein [Xylaria intraflava]|nr:Yqey-like protein-domain-containing protein [Xylaria intraflava]